MSGISVILPAYREGGNLRMLLPRVKAALDKTGEAYEVLVIDTATPTDETPALCEENGVTRVPRTPGDTYGDAIRTGFAAAQYAYLVVMDADGSHDPEDIPRFFAQMKTGQWDIVIGSRYTQGGQTKNSFLLRLMSYALNGTYRVLFGIKARDVSDSYRMYRAQQAKALTLECSHFDIVEEILIKLQIGNKDFAIKEIPIYFDKRQHGKSKRNLVKFVLSYAATMQRLLRIKRAAQQEMERV
ncbi:MAG: glycosyltransferase [Ruthenibacterium sp.]